MCVITLADYSIHCTYMKHTKLGKELQRLMKLHGFTYRRLHDVTGVNESQIRYIIRLGGTPTNAAAEKLDKALPGFFDYLQNVWRPLQEAAAEKDLEEDACASVEAGTPPAKRERLIPLIDSWAIHDLPAEGYDTESFNDQMADYCVSGWVLPPAGMPIDDDNSSTARTWKTAKCSFSQLERLSMSSATKCRCPAITLSPAMLKA